MTFNRYSGEIEDGAGLAWTVANNAGVNAADHFRSVLYTILMKALNASKNNKIILNILIDQWSLNENHTWLNELESSKYWLSR